MLRIVKPKKTEWEKLEALKQEKINSKATLVLPDSDIVTL